MGKYSKKVTGKKAVKNGVLYGVIGAGLIPVVLQILQGYPADFKIGGIVGVGVIVGLLTTIENYIKHRKD